MAIVVPGQSTSKQAPVESRERRLLRWFARLTSLEDVDDIRRGLLAAAIDVVVLDTAVLLLADRDGTRHPVCATGQLAEALAGAPDAALRELVERASGRRARAIAPDGVPELRVLFEHGVVSLATVDLRAGDESLGTLLLAGAGPLGPSADELVLLELLAAHAAACLRTAQLVADLRRQAASDPLTGLGHHATFHEALASSHRRPTTAVVLCDVDGFKTLNDTYGHQHGDHVLRGLADALSGALRRGDSLFRVGGDEFAALLVVDDDDEARDAATRLHAAAARAGLGVTVSVGAAIPHHGEPDDSVLERADRALYAAKAAGRDGVAVSIEHPAALRPSSG